jgi:hypothetical protein
MTAKPDRAPEGKSKKIGSGKVVSMYPCYNPASKMVPD